MKTTKVFIFILSAFVVCQLSLTSCSKTTAPNSTDAKADDAKADDAKANDAQNNDAKADDAKADAQVYADVDASEAGKNFGSELVLAKDGLYTFHKQGNAECDWEVYAVSKESWEKNGGPCRLVAQGCEDLDIDAPIALKEGTHLCIIPSVNSFTVEDDSQLLKKGDSLVHITLKEQAVEKGVSCEE